jgi:hypothetical protein
LWYLRFDCITDVVSTTSVIQSNLRYHNLGLFRTEFWLWKTFDLLNSHKLRIPEICKAPDLCLHIKQQNPDTHKYITITELCQK